MNTPLIFVGTGSAIAIGAERFSQGNVLKQNNYEVTDNLTIAAGQHLMTVGTHNEFFKFYNQFFPGSYGVWGFASAAALDAGTPNHYEIALPLRPNGPLAQFNVNQLGVYAQDIWKVTPKLALTYGVRVDDPLLPDQAGRQSGAGAVQFTHYTDDGSHATGAPTSRNTADFSTGPAVSPRLGIQLRRQRGSVHADPGRRRRVQRPAAVRLGVERLRQLGAHPGDADLQRRQRSRRSPPGSPPSPPPAPRAGRRARRCRPSSTSITASSSRRRCGRPSGWTTAAVGDGRDGGPALHADAEPVLSQRRQHPGRAGHRRPGEGGRLQYGVPGTPERLRHRDGHRR